MAEAVVLSIVFVISLGSGLVKNNVLLSLKINPWA